jgi:regulator of protease activity HflC (stomatin/prohibitin superfamily)
VNGKNEMNEYGAGMKALVGLVHYCFVVLSALIILLIAWYMTFAGYFTVNPQEAVLVLRFGKITDEFREGWHWTYPYPVCRIIKIPTTKQTIKIKAFWHRPNVNAFNNPSNNQGGPLNPAVDGYLLTGDANIIHTEWELVYEINDPTKYYTKVLGTPNPVEEDETVKDPATGKKIGTRGARTILKFLLDESVVGVSSRWNADEALYKNSSEYNRQVLNEFRKKLTTLDMGINADTLEVNLTGKTAPLAVNPAFQKVIESEQEMSKDIQNAREYAVKKENEADAEKSDVIDKAKGYRSRVVSQVESEEIYFKKILDEYRKNRETVILALYTDGITDFLLKVKDKYIIPSGDGQELRIMLNPEPVVTKEDTAKGGENQ